MKLLSLVGLVAAFPLLSAPSRPQVDVVELEKQVMDVERAFAKTMAERDHDAFASFLSEEAVFLDGSTPARGKLAVAARWKGYVDESAPPFSWEPKTVIVLDSGRLALSTGPVWNSSGKRTSTYTSIWRQESAGIWRIVLDKGNKYCE